MSPQPGIHGDQRKSWAVEVPPPGFSGLCPSLVVQLRDQVD
jgi:hypothetical protein